MIGAESSSQEEFLRFLAQLKVTDGHGWLADVSSVVIEDVWAMKKCTPSA